MQDCRCEHCGKTVAELVRLHRLRGAGKRGTDAKRQAAKNGFLDGPIPFGKRIGEDRKTLLDDPGEQATIKIILRLRDTGESYSGIADALITRGLKTKRGGKWFAKQVRDVVMRAG